MIPLLLIYFWIKASPPPGGGVVEGMVEMVCKYYIKIKNIINNPTS